MKKILHVEAADCSTVRHQTVSNLFKFDQWVAACTGSFTVTRLLQSILTFSLQKFLQSSLHNHFAKSLYCTVYTVKRQAGN